jgi:hypothetical protein
LAAALAAEASNRNIVPRIILMIFDFIRFPE